jgi:hypothetical protein
VVTNVPGDITISYLEDGGDMFLANYNLGFEVVKTPRSHNPEDQNMYRPNDYQFNGKLLLKFDSSVLKNY